MKGNQESIAKAQGRRAAYHEDRETCQVIQKISDEELLIRIFKARWAYKSKTNTPVKEIYENARLFIRAVGQEGTATDAYYYDSSYDSATHWRKDNVLLQSRLYPTDLEDQKTLYRSIVQQAIATCLDKPNLWSLKRGKDTEPYCESAADSNHYPDYKYGYAVASLLKGENDYGQMTIGSVARCVCCGGEQKNHRSIRCAECGNMYVCKGCGKTVHGYGRYIDEHFYCNECSYECAVCKEKFIGMPRIGIARSGEQRGICPACYAQVVDVCGNCTIHSDCLSIGANRFCPNQMSGLAA